MNLLYEILLEAVSIKSIDWIDLANIDEGNGYGNVITEDTEVFVKYGIDINGRSLEGNIRMFVCDLDEDYESVIKDCVEDDFKSKFKMRILEVYDIIGQDDEEEGRQ